MGETIGIRYERSCYKDGQESKRPDEYYALPSHLGDAPEFSVYEDFGGF
jgi:hypothetical protein